MIELSDRSLIAIQGTKSCRVLQNILLEKNLEELPYMNINNFHLRNGQEVLISRTGYTGEDGFEVSINNNQVINFWLDLCKSPDVRPIGLGARDSLRLEAGYPLYGHDLDETTSPIEASLNWIINKTNESFIGAKRILNEKSVGIKRKRVGVKLLTRGIAREGSKIINQNGQKIGILTSGGFSPNLKTSIGQCYVDYEYSTIGTEVAIIVRDKPLPAIIQSPIFVKAKTKTLKK